MFLLFCFVVLFVVFWLAFPPNTYEYLEKPESAVNGKRWIQKLIGLPQKLLRAHALTQRCSSEVVSSVHMYSPHAYLCWFSLKNPPKCSKNTPKSPPKPPQTPPRSPQDRPKSGLRSPQDRPFCIRYVCLPLAIGTNQKRYQN